MRRIATLLLLLLLISSFPLLAQHALDVRATVGFAGLFRAGTWTPVRLTLSNLGQAVRGTVSVEVERGDIFGSERRTVVHTRAVELARGAIKGYTFILPVETTHHPVTVRVTDAGQVVHLERYDLLGRGVPERLVLVLARRPNLDFLLPIANSLEQRSLDLVYPLPEQLPDRWHGYGAVDLVVLHDARLHDLSRSQVAALADWVGWGGRLVVSGGTHFGQAEAAALAPIHDFAVRGMGVTTLAEAGLDRLGLPVARSERDAPVVVTQFVRHGTLPTRIRLGAGEIVVLPADYAQLVRVAPLTSVALWNDLLTARPGESRVATESSHRVFESDVLANQLTLPVYGFPARLIVLGFSALAVTCIAGVILWLGSGRSRWRRALGAPALIAAIAAMATAGHVALTMSMQPVEALALTIEQAELTPAGGYAVVTRETALFSRGKAEYGLFYAGEPVIIPVHGRDHRVTIDVDRVEQRLLVERWGYESTVALQTVPIAISTSIRSAGDYVEVTIRNDSDRRIANLIMLRDGFPEPMGDLEPDSVLEHLSPQPGRGRFQSIPWEDLVPSDELIEHRARLAGDIARQQRFEGSTAPHVIVLGWTDRSLLPVSIAPDFGSTVDMNLFVLSLHLDRSAP